MRSFNMGRFGSDDPWFRVGTVDVTTTIFVIGVGVLSMFVYAIEGRARPLTKYLWLTSRDSGDAFGGGSVPKGQIWRLFTWPIPNEPEFWTIVMLFFFFIFGSQLEAMMGRRLFTAYLISLVVIPAILVTVFELLTGSDGAVFGLDHVETGVLIGYIVHRPNARFFFGIPAWGVGIAIVLLNFLQYAGDRFWLGVAMLFAVVATSLLAIRSLGFAEEAHWIPKVAAPAGLMSPGAPSRSSTSRRKRRGRAKLSVAPAPTAEVNPRRELSKLEEAEMDAILDQVSEHGMDSLTPQQRARLEAHSKRLRKRD